MSDDLFMFVALIALVAIAVGVIIGALCAIKAVQFIVGDRLRGRRVRAPLSEHVPLEPIRPLEQRVWTELDARRARREEARDPEHTC